MANLSRYLFKIALCGSGGIGKTSLFNRFISNTFRLEQLMTIGMNYATHYMNTPEDRVELQLWDYGGQLKYRPLLTKFLEGTSGALLMFDLTRFASFNELDEWHNLLESKLQEKIPILLVGCKLDLCEQDPSEGVVPEKEIYAYMQRRKCLDFIKTSAKTGKNIQLCFEKIVNALLHKSDR